MSYAIQRPQVHEVPGPSRTEAAPGAAVQRNVEFAQEALLPPVQREPSGASAPHLARIQQAFAGDSAVQREDANDCETKPSKTSAADKKTWTQAYLKQNAIEGMLADLGGRDQMKQGEVFDKVIKALGEVVAIVEEIATLAGPDKAVFLSNTNFLITKVEACRDAYFSTYSWDKELAPALTSMREAVAAIDSVSKDSADACKWQKAAGKRSERHR